MKFYKNKLVEVFLSIFPKISFYQIYLITQNKFFEILGKIIKIKKIFISLLEDY